MARYYINLHPFRPCASIIIGPGGFISKEFTEENSKWIQYTQRREFSFNVSYLYKLLRYLRSRNPDDCEIFIRNERTDEWQELKENQYFRERLEILDKEESLKIDTDISSNMPKKGYSI